MRFARTHVVWTLLLNWLTPLEGFANGGDRSHPARATPVNVIEATRAAYHELRKSERKVADVCLPIPVGCCPRRSPRPPNWRMSASRLSFASATPSGAPAFRNSSYVSPIVSRSGRLRRIRCSPTRTISSRSSGKIFDYTITSLDWARNHLDRARSRRRRLLGDARAIEFFGFGASGIVAMDAQQKFPLFGAPCGAQVDSHQRSWRPP